MTNQYFQMDDQENQDVEINNTFRETILKILSERAQDEYIRYDSSEIISKNAPQENIILINDSPESQNVELENDEEKNEKENEEEKVTRHTESGAVEGLQHSRNYIMTWFINQSYHHAGARAAATVFVSDYFKEFSEPENVDIFLSNTWKFYCKKVD